MPFNPRGMLAACPGAAHVPPSPPPAEAAGEARPEPRMSRDGGVAEWSKAPVLKTGEPRGSVGSNPTPTAIPHAQSA